MTNQTANFAKYNITLLKFIFKKIIHLIIEYYINSFIA